MAEKSFGDLAIELAPLTGLKCLRAFHRLGKCFLPSIVKAIGAIGADTKVASVDVGNIEVGKLGEALESLFLNCSEEDLAFFAKEFLYGGIANHSPIEKVFDVVFQGKTLTLLKVLVWAVVEVHYADFFADLPGLLARAQALAASQKMSASISKADSLKTKS